MAQRSNSVGLGKEVLKELGECLESQRNTLIGKRDPGLNDFEPREIAGNAGDICTDIATLATLNERERRKLQKIDLAIFRLKRGDYGRCQECGELIQLGRLKIVPWTELCIDCKAEQELVEKNFPKTNPVPRRY